MKLALTVVVLVLANFCASSARADECLTDAQITTHMMPPDLYKAAAVCIQKKDVQQSSFLFYLASAYVGYDMERIVDPDAELKSSDLLTEALVSPDQKNIDLFRAEFARGFRDTKRIAEVCERIIKIGPPAYEIPTYLITNKDNPGPEMMAILNRKGTWMRILEQKIRCTNIKL